MFQGMNFVVGMLLLIVKEEEKVFWLMDTLMNNILPSKYNILPSKYNILSSKYNAVHSKYNAIPSKYSTVHCKYNAILSKHSIFSKVFPISTDYKTNYMHSLGKYSTEYSIWNCR